MSNEVQAAGLFKDLDWVVQVRHEIADSLGAIAQTLTQAESEGEKTSGKLGLERTVEVRLGT